MVLMYAFTMPLSRAAVALFSALLIVMLIVHPKWKERFIELGTSDVFRAFLLFFVFSLLTLLWTSSENLHDAFRYIGRMWYILPAFAIFIILPKEMIFKVLSAFLLGMIISEILSFGIFFEWWSINGKTTTDPTPFMHRIIYSAFLTVTSLIVFNKFFDQNELKYKIIYFIYFLVVTSNLFINGGRTGQMAFIVAMFVLGFMRIKNKIFAFFVIAALQIVIFTTAYNVSPNFNQRINQGGSDISKAVNQNQYCSSWGVRLAYIIGGSQIVFNNPLLGVGYGDDMDMMVEMSRLTNPEFKCAHGKHFHNQYIQTSTQSGLVGLGLLLLFLYTVFKIKIENVEIRNIKWILLSTYVVTFIPEPLFGRQFSLALFALMLGLILAQYRTEKIDLKREGTAK